MIDPSDGLGVGDSVSSVADRGADSECSLGAGASVSGGAIGVGATAGHGVAQDRGLVWRG